jgi:hypothetical protein
MASLGGQCHISESVLCRIELARRPLRCRLS